MIGQFPRTYYGVVAFFEKSPDLLCITWLDFKTYPKYGVVTWQSQCSQPQPQPLSSHLVSYHQFSLTVYLLYTYCVLTLLSYCVTLFLPCHRRITRFILVSSFSYQYIIRLFLLIHECRRSLIRKNNSTEIEIWYSQIPYHVLSQAQERNGFPTFRLLPLATTGTIQRLGPPPKSWNLFLRPTLSTCYLMFRHSRLIFFTWDV